MFPDRKTANQGIGKLPLTSCTCHSVRNSVRLLCLPDAVTYSISPNNAASKRLGLLTSVHCRISNVRAAGTSMPGADPCVSMQPPQSQTRGAREACRSLESCRGHLVSHGYLVGVSRSFVRPTISPSILQNIPPRLITLHLPLLSLGDFITSLERLGCEVKEPRAFLSTTQ